MNKIFPQIFTTPSGDTMVVLPLADYQALLDAADIAVADRALAEVGAGRDEFVPEALVDRLLAGENRVRVWREYRQLSVEELAVRAGLTPARVAELEADGSSDEGALTELARALDLDLDDLVA